MPDQSQDAGPEDQPVPVITVTETAAAPAPGPDLAAVRAQAISDERARVTAITDLCARVRQAPLAADYIAAGYDVEQARAALLDVWAGASGPAIRAGTSEEPAPPAAAWKATIAKINQSHARV